MADTEYCPEANIRIIAALDLGVIMPLDLSISEIKAKSRLMSI